MSATEIITYQDIVEHILDMFDEDRAGRPLRVARRAARESLRELHMAHRWSYYTSERTFVTAAAQTTGTITYDHTGGSYERLLTLADATWPTNVTDYKIIIDDVHYPIERYLTTTTVTLDPNNNPGADVAAGTSYKIYRESYPLPVNFGDFGNLIDLTNNRVVPVISSDVQLSSKEIAQDTPDTPWQVAIRNAGEYLNSLSFVFVPPPGSEIRYRYTFQRAPRSLETEVNSTGTCSANSGSTSVTMSGDHTLTAKHLGAVLRFGTAAAVPTNIFGGIDGTDNPFVDQGIILSIYGTAVVIDNAVSQTHTDVMFTVSDPVDIENNIMLTAYQRMCEARFTSMTKRELKDRRDREELALFALRLAKERDNKSLNSPTYSSYDPFSRVTVTDTA